MVRLLFYLLSHFGSLWVRDANGEIGNKVLEETLKLQHAQVVKDMKKKAEEHERLLNAKATYLQEQIHAEKHKNRVAQASLDTEVNRLRAQLLEATGRKESAQASLERQMSAQSKEVAQLKRQLEEAARRKDAAQASLQRQIEYQIEEVAYLKSRLEEAARRKERWDIS